MTLGNGTAENRMMRLPLEKILDRYIAAGWGTNLPAGFKAVVKNNAHYEKRDGSLSDKAFYALVFEYEDKPLLEISMFQWDLLRDNLHKFARENASPTMTTEEWFNKVATFFAEPEKIQLVKTNYRGKTADTDKVKGHLYNGCLIGFNKIG